VFSDRHFGSVPNLTAPRAHFPGGDYFTYRDAGDAANAARDVLKVSFVHGQLTDTVISKVHAALSPTPWEPPPAVVSLPHLPQGVPLPPPPPPTPSTAAPDPAIATLQAQVSRIASALEVQQASASPMSTPQTTPRKNRGRNKKGGGGGGPGPRVPNVTFELNQAEPVVPSGPRVAYNPTAQMARQRIKERAEARRARQALDEAEAAEEMQAAEEIQTAIAVEDLNRVDNIRAVVTDAFDENFKVSKNLGQGGATVRVLEDLAAFYGVDLRGTRAQGNSRSRWPPNPGLSVPLRRAVVGLLVETATDHYLSTLSPDFDPIEIPAMIPRADTLRGATPCRREAE